MSRFTSAKHRPPPCLASVVTRNRLLEAIERERHKRLLLVHASAGYGKTVLLSQWRDVVQKSGAVSIWVSLEKADSAPEKFLASLASGLAGEGIPAANEPQRDQYDVSIGDQLAALLLLTESSTRETWLTLEDWHRVVSEPVSELLETLLRNMPPNWHVALSSRSRPQLNVLMLRAQGQVIELAQDALRFTSDETRFLMVSTGLPMPAVEELVDLTEGWPIALQLAQLWLSHDGKLGALRSSFLESIDGMTDFIAAEVFSILPHDFRDFLLESSICARFTSDLINCVRERSDSDRILEALRSPNGLTVALADTREWYRHHRILGEFLVRERRRLPAERIADLHRRAAIWFERQGMLFDAVEHARLSGDEARTIRLVEDAGCVDICIRTGAPAVRALLDSLPSDVVRERPRLRAAYMAMNLKLGSIGRSGELLAELKRSLEVEGMDAVLRRDLLVVTSLRQCFIDESPSSEDLVAHRRSLEAFADADWWLNGLMRNVQGRLEMRRGLLEDAVRSLADADHVFESNGSAQGHFFMLANLAICHLFLGKLALAENYFGQADVVLRRQLGGASIYTGVVQTVEALLLYERNELTAAGHAAQLALAGLELAEGCFEQYFSSIQVAARVAFAVSGFEAAMRVIERGRRLARYHGLTRMGLLLDHLHLRLIIDSERWELAARMAAQLYTHPSPASDIGWLEHDLSVPAQCLVALHEGRPGDAHLLAQEMAQHCRIAGRLPAQIRAQILEALAATMLNDRVAACSALRGAIELASGQGLLQPFFEIDGPMLSLLRDFQRTEAAGLLSIQADFLSGLILRLIAAGKARAHTESLTTRECQILNLLSHGGSNKVIARGLNLTENAVKFHLKNIFRKLQVDNRAMAAQVARRMDLGVSREPVQSVSTRQA